MRLVILISTLFLATSYGQVKPPGVAPRPIAKPVQRGYHTSQVAGGYGVPAAVGYGGQSAAYGGGADFNPALAGGVRGYPGIKARINQRGFQYFSSLIAPVLDQEIKRARIPPISQCVPQVNGCIQVYNLYVSRYRCPQRVVIYPAPPNKVVVAVQNVDVGVTGNLGGQINILIPIQLMGIIQVNAHQVSITVELTITRGPTGAPYIQVSGCHATVGYLDAYIENGGLIGDIANSQFRGQISGMIRKMLPEQLCAQIPNIVNSKLNGQLGGIPQSIALTQMLQLAGGALGLGGAAGGTCAPQCKAAQKTPVVAQPLPAPVAAPAAPPAPVPPQTALAVGAQKTSATAQTVAPVAPPRDLPPAPTYASGSVAPPAPLAQSTSPYARRYVRVVTAGSTQLLSRPIANSHLVNSGAAQRIANRRSVRHAVAQNGTRLPQPVVARPRARAHGSGVAFPPAGAPNPCASCPGANTDTLSQLQELTKYLDISKLNDIYLTVQLLQTYATTNDYTIELNGEFSPGGQGGTPFGAYPMQFPSPVGSKMAEVLISDFTINSLFYSLQRKNFLSFRLGPETPKIGPLLKTTCSDDEDDEGLEDHGVDEDEEPSRRRRRVVRRALALTRTRRDEGGLADLGICFGDILPVAREKYPNQNIVIHLRTERAPSVILSARNGGTAILDLLADADIFTEKNDKIGTIRVAATFEVAIHTSASGITGHGEITNLKLTNPDGTLGLTQEALDNLGNLGKELVAKAANDVLEKGIPLSIPSGGAGLPLNFINPEVHILEHAIHLESDFTISPSFLAQLGASGAGGVCRRR